MPFGGRVLGGDHTRVYKHMGLLDYGANVKANCSGGLLWVGHCNNAHFVRLNYYSRLFVECQGYDHIR